MNISFSSYIEEDGLRKTICDLQNGDDHYLGISKQSQKDKDDRFIGKKVAFARAIKTGAIPKAYRLPLWKNFKENCLNKRQKRRMLLDEKV